MKEKIKDHKLFQTGVMILVVVLISFCLLAVVLNLEATGNIFKTIGNVCMPLVLGVVFAYLMNPLMNFMHRRLLPFFRRRKMAEKKAYRLSRALSATFAVACADFDL